MTPQVLQVLADAPTVLILVGKNLCDTNRKWPRICKLCGAVLSTVYGWLPWMVAMEGRTCAVQDQLS